MSSKAHPSGFRLEAWEASGSTVRFSASSENLQLANCFTSWAANFALQTEVENCRSECSDRDLRAKVLEAVLEGLADKRLVQILSSNERFSCTMPHHVATKTSCLKLSRGSDKNHLGYSLLTGFPGLCIILVTDVHDSMEDMLVWMILDGEDALYSEDHTFQSENLRSEKARAYLKFKQTLNGCCDCRILRESC